MAVRSQIDPDSDNNWRAFAHLRVDFQPDPVPVPVGSAGGAALLLESYGFFLLRRRRRAERG